MMITDGVFLVFVLFVVGFVGFFVMAIVLVAKFFGFIFRALGGPGASPERTLSVEGKLICQNNRCHHQNPQQARFCARCGHPLTEPADVDAYG